MKSREGNCPRAFTSCRSMIFFIRNSPLVAVAMLRCSEAGLPSMDRCASSRAGHRALGARLEFPLLARADQSAKAKPFREQSKGLCHCARMCFLERSREIPRFQVIGCFCLFGNWESRVPNFLVVSGLTTGLERMNFPMRMHQCLVRHVASRFASQIYSRQHG